MPFDGFDFRDRRGLPEPPRRPAPAPAPGEALIVRIVLLYALLLLIFPISADALMDVIRYARGH